MALRKITPLMLLLSLIMGCAARQATRAAAEEGAAPGDAQPGIAQAGSTQPGVAPLPKGASVYRLDNGMEALLIENPALPMVGVNVLIKVGSAYETFASSGMSHMLEHLLFNGTASRDQKKLYDDADRIGAYNNANTAEFYTNFMIVTPAEHIRRGMEIQADMLFNSLLPEDKFEKEKGIVLEEIARSLANAEEQAERNALAALYPGHALSLPTLGTYNTIQNMSRDAVYAFYKNHYVPNNMILTAAGNFRSDSLLAMIKEIYGKAAPGMVRRGEGLPSEESDPQWATGFQRPAQMPPLDNRAQQRFYGGADVQLQIFFPIPQFPQPEALELIDLALARQTDSLQTLLQQEFPEQVKSLSAGTRPSPVGNYVQFSAALAANAEVQKISGALARRAAEVSFALPGETVQAQAVKARTDFLKNIEKPHMFGIYNAHLLAVGGIDAALASAGGKGYYPAAEQIRALKLIGAPIILVQHPRPQTAAAPAGGEKSRGVFSDDPSGLTVIAAQNEVSDLLAVHYLVGRKAMLESRYGKDAAKILHDCLGQRLESQQNQQAGSRFGFTYTVNDNPMIPMDDIYLHPDFGYIRVEGLAEDLPGAIGYLNRQLAGFIPTEEEFRKAQGKFKHGGMAMGGQAARKMFDETVDAILYEENRYPEGPALAYENLLAFAKEYFQPGNMVISAVSPVAPDSLNRLFRGFAANAARPEFAATPAFDRGFKMPAEALDIEKPGGGEQSYLFWGFLREVEARDKPALKALSLVLGDRIIFDIREKQGMAYRMSAGIDLKQDKALFYIRMGTRPQNVDKLLPQYPGFFDAKLLSDLSAEELEKTVNMYLGRMMFRRLSSINQAFYLGNSFYFYGDVEHDEDFLSELKTVTVSDVQRVANKYLKAENPVQVVVR